MKVSQTSWHHQIYARSGHANEPLGRVAYIGVVFCAVILATFGLLFAALGALFLAQAFILMTGLAASEGSGSAGSFLIIGTFILGVGLSLAHRPTGMFDRPVSWVKQRFMANQLAVTE